MGTVVNMRGYRRLLLSLPLVVGACGGGSGPGPAERPATASTVAGTVVEDAGVLAADVAVTIAADVNRVAGPVVLAADTSSLDGMVEAFVGIAAALDDVRSAIDPARYPGIELRFAFDDIPLIIEVIGPDGTYCVDFNEDQSTDIAVVVPGVCSGDAGKLAAVGSLFSGDPAAVDAVLDGLLGGTYTGHLDALVDAVAARVVAGTSPADAVDAVAAAAAGILRDGFGWTITTDRGDGIVLVVLTASDGSACGLVTDDGRSVAVGGPCPVGDVGTLTTIATAPDDRPYGYGDDPVLDDLWDSCRAGEANKCDDLYDAAPVGSLYEVFGGSCGGGAVVAEPCTGTPSGR